MDKSWKKRYSISRIFQPPFTIAKPIIVYALITASSWIFSLILCVPVRFKAFQLPNLPVPVSIIIPVYNKETYLQRAIRSALNQTLRSIEVVIVDDCSTDSSISVIQRMEHEDSRIKLIRHEHNMGTHAARITAVKGASGEYILSLDPDDFISPSIAEDSLTAALKNDADIVEFNALEVINGRVKLFAFLNPPTTRATNQQMLELFRTHRLNWNLWKRLIRRKVYQDALEILTPELTARRIIYAEDKLHFGLIALRANGYVYLKQIGYIYFRDNPDNSESGTQQTPVQCLNQLNYVDRVLRYLYRTEKNLPYFISDEHPPVLDQ